MKEEYGKMIEKLLPQILSNAEAARKANKIVPVRGKRITLPLQGRTIDAVYYSAKNPKAPLFLGFHGGGFLFGGCAMDDDLWVNVSDFLDVNVVSIDYRMSPEVKDFDSLYDCYDSAEYLISHAEEYGFDPDHVSVFGSSAGGNLAAALCLLAKERGKLSFDYQILMYPFLDGATDPDSKGSGSFTGILPHVMNQLHFSPDKAKDPLLSPIYAETDSLKGLPRTIIACCEYDNLANEARAYGQKLQAAGVEVSVFYAEKMPHGYIEFGFKPEPGKMDLEMMGEHAEEILSGGLLRQRCEETLAFIRKVMDP